MTGGIPCMVLRGGTSKGVYLVGDDLPRDRAELDATVLAIMGSPHPRQIDGLGGAHPLTSKVAVVSRSAEADRDVDFLFLQVGVGEGVVGDRQTCGNLLAGVGPFAVERGLVQTAADGQATVRIGLVNTGGFAIARFAISSGFPVYRGDYRIDGVSGTAGPIDLEFVDTVGSTCGSLFPTGGVRDDIDGIEITCVDNGIPVVVVRGSDVGITGYESVNELEADPVLAERVESIRLRAGVAMGLGDVAQLTIPKVTLVSAPKAGGHLCTRTFIPHRVHEAIGVLGAVSVATAAALDGTIANEVVEPGVRSGAVTIEHPSGEIDALVEVASECDTPTVVSSGIRRTARKIMDGEVFIDEVSRAG